jgi:hypothetical protein
LTFVKMQFYAQLNARLRLLLSAAIMISAVLMPSLVANAASGSLYMAAATDPHGEVWLHGTVDGTTAGPMSTAPTDGHLWTADVASGFCRVDLQPDGTFALAKAIVGGCITTAGKTSQPTLDARRNANGTFYVYTCDWGVGSLGCYRLTYDPGAQIMTGAENLAPGQFPAAQKPFATALGTDGSLYVTSDLTPYIYRFTSPNDPIVANQTVQIIGVANDGTRMRAETFACWDTLRGGLTGRPTCAQMATAGNPTPDLVLAQKAKVTVLLDAQTCAGVAIDPVTLGPVTPPTCVSVDARLRVLTPMGAFTEPGNPDVIYITDSPGTVSQLIRYTISTNTQDSYSNFGVLPDGTIVQYAFAFSPTRGADGGLYMGDDPSAGAAPLNGRLWRIPPGAPPDVAGAPGLPASPPVPPSQKVGVLNGSGTTTPQGGIWLPGALGGHLWVSDTADAFCRMDLNPAPGPSNPPTASGAPFTLNVSTCNVFVTKPGQPAYDPVAQPDGTHFVYLPDGIAGAKSIGLGRVTFDPNGTVCGAPETVCNPMIVAPGTGLDGQSAHAAAIDPATGAVYVGFLNRTTLAPTEIARVRNPSSPTPTVEFIANTPRHKPIFNLAFIGPDLYVGNNGGLDIVLSANLCVPGACTTNQLLNIRGPHGMVSDGVDKIYMASPAIPVGCPPICPAPGTLNTPVQVYSVSTGDLFTFSSQAGFLDNSLGRYDVIQALILDPTGNLMVADDPSAAGAPFNGRIFKVPSTDQVPIPTITSKPNTPTNQTNPTFVFQSADPAATFRCSLVQPLLIPDAFTPCTAPATYGTVAGSTTPVLGGAGPLADGEYAFKVQGVDALGNLSFITSAGFIVDTVPPVLTITSQPASPSNKNTPTFGFIADKAGTTFLCSLVLQTAPDAFAACTSPTTYTQAVPDGAYRFALKATDPAGNVSIASTTLVIDTLAPTITASPIGGQFTTAQSVVLTASEPATIYYTVDGTTPTTATLTKGPSPVTVNVANSETLQYFGVDVAGNAGAVASQKYQIGAVTITQNPPALTFSNTPTFAFMSTAAGSTFQCSLTTAATPTFSPCTSPITYPAQPDGSYTFTVQGTDVAGNLSTSQFAFTINAAPPVVTITQNPPNPSTNATATFAFTANKAGSTFQCSLVLQTAADTFAACTSPKSYTTADGQTYRFAVIGTDTAGHASAPVTYTFSVSLLTLPTVTVPVVTLVSGNTASTSSVPVNISWTGTACQSGVTSCNIASYHLQENVNNVGFVDVALASPTATSVARTLKPSAANNSTPVTTYTYRVQATDKAGNLSAFALGPQFTLPDIDNSFNTSFSGSWSGANLTGAFGGSVQFSSTASSFAQPANAFSATSVAFVSTLGPDRGKAQITLDNVLVATVDLYAPTLQPAQVVWSTSGLKAAPTTHTVKVTVAGTKNAASTGTRVDYDAILTLK